MTASLFQNLVYWRCTFRPIARDGAGNISDDPSSKAFNSMYAIDNPAMKIAAMHHSYESLKGLK
jgi:hypothetical protein